MVKRGRPGISYEQFVEVWEQLLMEGRAGTNAALEILGGNKSTIAGFREQYEREKASKTLSLIKSIELSEAVHRAIAEVKVKEIQELEKINFQLKARIDEHLANFKECEKQLAASKVDIDDLKVNFDLEKTSLVRKLAASEGRCDDLGKREEKLHSEYAHLSEQYNQAKQEAAVAKKEVEMLREQTKK